MAGGASAIMMFHNHPSGDPWPSGDDLMMTKRMFEAGEMMGIMLIDHLVLAGNSYYSFRENRVPGMPPAFNGRAFGKNAHGQKSANGYGAGSDHVNGSGPASLNGSGRGPGVRMFAAKTAFCGHESQLR